MSASVHSIVGMDHIDARNCQNMTNFKQQDVVRTKVKLTRCLYAMLQSKQVWPSKKSNWNLPDRVDSSFNETLGGFKLTCGLEILCSNLKIDEEKGKREKLSPHMENKLQKINKENNKLANYESLQIELSKILENQRIGKKKQDQILETTQRGFIGLALRNEELLEVNKELRQQLSIVVTELNLIKEERQEKEIRKQARANRKRLPKREPMTAKIYNKLLQAAEGPAYIDVRLRIAICLLTITGIRINELLPLKVYQLQTLVEEGWIAIDRSKRGPANHKAFLTKEGKKLVKDRQKDFQFIFLMKEPDSYVFTNESNHSKILTRETITKAVNLVTRKVSEEISSKPNITSHSFRIGYITQLWKDSKDIEFVKQTIGHRKLDTTSAYVKKLSDHERQKRIDQLK